MLLALIVGVGALVALSATVDTYERFFVATVSNSSGDFDLVISKKEIEPELLIDDRLIPLIREADPAVTRVVPRLQGVVEVDVTQPVLTADDNDTPETSHGSAKFIALDRSGQLLFSPTQSQGDFQFLFPGTEIQNTLMQQFPV